jgi:hypothetical protein
MEVVITLNQNSIVIAEMPNARSIQAQAILMAIFTKKWLR